MLAIRLAALVMNLRSSWSISETTNEIHLHFRETLGKALCKTDEEINCIKMMLRGTILMRVTWHCWGDLLYVCVNWCVNSCLLRGTSILLFTSACFVFVDWCVYSCLLHGTSILLFTFTCFMFVNWCVNCCLHGTSILLFTSTCFMFVNWCVNSCLHGTSILLFTFTCFTAPTSRTTARKI